VPTVVRTPWIVLALRHLPGPVRGLLDAWSRQVARRHARARQEAWQRRQKPADSAAAATGSPAPTTYQLKPWRD